MKYMFFDFRELLSIVVGYDFCLIRLNMFVYMINFIEYKGLEIFGSWNFVLGWFKFLNYFLEYFIKFLYESLVMKEGEE